MRANETLRPTTCGLEAVVYTVHPAANVHSSIAHIVAKYEFESLPPHAGGTENSPKRCSGLSDSGIENCLQISCVFICHRTWWSLTRAAPAAALSASSTVVEHTRVLLCLDRTADLLESPAAPLLLQSPAGLLLRVVLEEND